MSTKPPKAAPLATHPGSWVLRIPLSLQLSSVVDGGIGILISDRQNGSD